MQLSPSKLNVLNDCPRCFWIEGTLAKRPRGIFPSLPGGMDRVFKVYFDQFRGSLPGILKEQLPMHALYDNQANLKRWRFWKSGLTATVQTRHGQVTLIGALDDLLINTETGQHEPLDYKTKGSEPKDDGRQYYQTQLDCYTLMLESNRLKVSGKAHLIYFWPDEIAEADGTVVSFKHALYTLDASPTRAKELIHKAAEILAMLTPPEQSATCEYCTFHKNRRKYDDPTT